MKNVGIIDIEVYYPNLYVEQSELEENDECIGKYIKGLGQTRLAVCSIIEDTVSMCLTVLKRLMSRKNLNYSQIGRLEVGTETSVDLSKSIKSHLMQLFNNEHMVEGADSINACYGSTAALFNTINWIYSPGYDDRFGIVVCADIATYSNLEPSARATGGAGAVCMLIGPNSSIVLEPIKSHYMTHCYDFYKPNHLSFPLVDGRLSLMIYIQSLLNCCSTLVKLYSDKNQKLDLLNFEHIFVFHCPYIKLVKKSYGYVCYYFNERFHNNKEHAEILDYINKLFSDTSLQEEKSKLESELSKKYEKEFYNHLNKSLLFAGEIGNSYTASLYFGLSSVLAKSNHTELVNKRIFMYAYGSGSLSSLFSLKFINDSNNNIQEICDNLHKSYLNLQKRTKVSPQFMFNQNEKRTSIEEIQKELKDITVCQMISTDTYYLNNIDNKFRRNYIYYS